MNQGMLMESLNLAAVWKLPVVLLCKDDEWSITTNSKRMTGGDLRQRVGGFGIPVVTVEGLDVAAVWQAARSAVEHARAGKGPTFLYASCVHLEAHFLGFQLLRIARRPLKELPQVLFPLIKSFFQPKGASLRERFQGLKVVMAAIISTVRDSRQDLNKDPLVLVRSKLLSNPERLQELDDKIKGEISVVLNNALMEVPS